MPVNTVSPDNQVDAVSPLALIGQLHTTVRAHKSLALLLLLGIVATGMLLTFLTPPAYESSIKVLVSRERARFASGKRLPLSLVMSVARGLVATNHQRVALLGNLIGVVSCCLLGWWFIARFGATGAAAHLQIAQNCFSGRESINRFTGC